MSTTGTLSSIGECSRCGCMMYQGLYHTCSTAPKTKTFETNVTYSDPPLLTKKDCDCEYEMVLKNGLCRKCEDRFYKKAFKTNLL